MHGKVQGTGAASDNGARGRCTGAREGAGRGPRQSAITVHGDGARVGCRGRCRGPGQSAITVHGDGVRVKGTGAERDSTGTVHGVHGKVQEGDRGRAR